MALRQIIAVGLNKGIVTKNSMNTSELRINNWVKTDKGIGTIASIRKNEPEHYAIGVNIMPLQRYEYMFKQVEGIPITPELLVEKCGFEKEDMGEGMTHQIYLPAAEGFAINWHNGSICFEDMGTPVKYLHQLQNLYHALTGEELPVTL